MALGAAALHSRRTPDVARSERPGRNRVRLENLIRSHVAQDATKLLEAADLLLVEQSEDGLWFGDRDRLMVVVDRDAEVVGKDRVSVAMQPGGKLGDRGARDVDACDTDHRNRVP